MPRYNYNYYESIPEALTGKAVSAEAVRAALMDALGKRVPSLGKWDFMLQFYTSNPIRGKDVRQYVADRIADDKVRYGFGHVKNFGVTAFCRVDHPRDMVALIQNAPGVVTGDISYNLHELSCPLVGMDILMQSTRDFQEQIKHQQIPDPYGIYAVNVDTVAKEIPYDINFGTVLRPIDTDKALYLITERMDSFGVRVDPLADLAIHVLSIKSVFYLIESYKNGSAVLFFKPPTDIGSVRLLNVASIPELEAEVRGHPWYGTNGPHQRTVEPVLPLEEVIG